jgi:hypothetical protein
MMHLLFSSRLASTLLFASILCGTTGAFADILFENAPASTSVSVRLTSADIFVQHDDSDSGARVLADFPLSLSSSDGDSQSGFSASGSAMQSASIIIDSETGVLTGDVSGEISGTATVPGPNLGTSSVTVSSSFRLFFEVVDTPATLVVSGSLSTGGGGIEICNLQSTYRLLSGSDELAYIRTCSIEFPDEGLGATESVDESLLLQPGRYVISFSAASSSINPVATGSGSGSFSGQFTLTPEPEVVMADIIFWEEGTGGDFDASENW